MCQLLSASTYIMCQYLHFCRGQQGQRIVGEGGGLVTFPSLRKGY